MNTTTSHLPLEDHVGLPPDKKEALSATLARFHSVADVLQWGLLQQPAWEFVDIVIQDEYCHDLIMALPDDLHLVFDTT